MAGDAPLAGRALPSRPYFPHFPWQLSDADKYAYACLRTSISTNTIKSPRNRRVFTFTETLDAIKSYVLRGEKDSGLRALLCGLCWLPEGIAINTHQLRLLIPKCKSSINGSLQKLGYSMILGRTDCAQAMCNFFPLLRDNQAELRKWTIRKRVGFASSVGEFEIIRPPEIESTRRRSFEISLDGLSKSRRVSEFSAVFEPDPQEIGSGFGSDLLFETDRSWELTGRLDSGIDYRMRLTDPMDFDKIEFDDRLNCHSGSMPIDFIKS
jgi:hypothetical protein